MDNNTLNLVNSLATGLSTTSEHIMQVLIKQAYISSSVHVVCYLALSYICYFVLKRTSNTIRINESKGDADNGGYIAFSYLIGLWLAISTLILLPLEIETLLNPEFWAIERARHLLKFII